jgi:hypothetical protein
LVERDLPGCPIAKGGDGIPEGTVLDDRVRKRTPRNGSERTRLKRTYSSYQSERFSGGLGFGPSLKGKPVAARGDGYSSLKIEKCGLQTPVKQARAVAPKVPFMDAGGRCELARQESSFR